MIKRFVIRRVFDRHKASSSEARCSEWEPWAQGSYPLGYEGCRGVTLRLPRPHPCF